MPRLLTHILGVALLGIPLALNAQMRPRAFNVGISWGYGGMHTLFMPSLDLTYNTTALRASWAPALFSVAVNQGIYRILQDDNMRLDLIVSLGYFRSNNNWYLQAEGINFFLTPVDGGKALVGIHHQIGSRFYYRTMLGVAQNHRRITGNFHNNTEGEWRTWPNLEIGLGVRLFSLGKTNNP